MRQLVPPFILENYARGKFSGDFSAVGLFVDISGFSTLTDTLMQHGQHGAEVLARIMRRVFGPLSQSIFEQGGFIVGYAGDALTALFPAGPDGESNVQRAIAAAWAIQQQMSAEPAHVTEYGVFPISAKVGVADGEAVWGILRSQDGQWATYFFQGMAVNGPAAAEHSASAGEIILSAGIYQRIRDMVKAEPLGEFYRLTEVTGALPAPQPFIPPHASFADAMNVFFPETLLNTDLRSEFRQAINLFISLPELSGAVMKSFIELVFNLQALYGGLFTRVDFGDKGCNLLLFWGAPVAYENDIERALNFILDLKAQADFQFTAGLTYYVSRAGFMGSDLMEEYTCYGWGINLAARLMLSAPLGAIWLDERVAKRAGRRFEVDFIGEQKFKGFAHNQKVFVLGGRKDEAEKVYEGEMVGRDVELQALADFVAPLWQGQYAGSFTVWGDPGMGKSRLVYEFQISPFFKAHAALWGLCQSNQILRESFNPLRYWLRHYFNVSNVQDETRNKSNFDVHLDGLIDSTSDKALASELDRTRSFLAAMVDLYWPDSLYGQMDARGRYDNTFIALTALIKAESLRQPVILFVEDAQYLDSDSNAFIQSLTRALKADPIYPVAMLSTSRREGAALPLDRWLLDQELDLGGLPSSALARLVESILENPADTNLLRLLEERADGNPFFAEQILRHLQEESLLVLGENGWRVVENLPESTLSADIKVVLVARLDQLTREVRNVIQTASILGREFEVQVLAHMLRDDRALGQKIVEAEKAAIWRAMTEIRYIFKHALLRDTAYTMQMQARRQELHALAVESLESVFVRQVENHYGELAYHAEQANLTEKARFYLQKAGTAAQDAYQNNPAIDYFTRALALTPESDLQTRYALHLSRQNVYHLQGKSQEEEQGLNTLQSLAEELRDKARQARVAIQQSDYWIRVGNYPLAVEKASLAVTLARETGRDDLEVDAIFSIVDACYRQGEYAAALRYGEPGLALARKMGAREIEGRLLNMLGLVIWEQKSPAAARTYFEQSLVIFREIGNLRAEAQPLSNLGIIAGYDADYAAAQSYYEQSLALAHQVGDRRDESSFLTNLGWIAGLQGNFRLARGYVEQTLRIAREIDDRVSEIYGLINLSAYAGALGDTAAALQAARQGLLLARETQNRNAEAWALTYQGHVLLALGRGPEARDAYQAALEIRLEKGQTTLAAEPYAGLARVALGQNDLAAARACVEPILAHLDGGNTLDGTDEPLRVYLTCYLALRALKNERAASILETARDLLLARAGNITDEALRRSFLENIPYHRDILAAWEGK